MSLSRESAQLFLNAVKKQLPTIETTARGVRITPRGGGAIEIRQTSQTDQIRGVTLR